MSNQKPTKQQVIETMEQIAADMEQCRGVLFLLGDKGQVCECCVNGLIFLTYDKLFPNNNIDVVPMKDGSAYLKTHLNIQDVSDDSYRESWESLYGLPRHVLDNLGIVKQKIQEDEYEAAIDEDEVDNRSSMHANDELRWGFPQIIDAIIFEEDSSE